MSWRGVAGTRARCFCIVAAALLFLPAIEAADKSVPPITSRIERVPVKSSAIAAVGYSKKLRAFEIEFRNGAIYRHLEVPARLYQGLLAAESKASYYHRHIRGIYYSVRVKDGRRVASEARALEPVASRRAGR